MEYSPFAREVETQSGTNLLETCRELGVTVVCSSPLGRGLITGRFTTQESISGEGDIRGTYFPRFSGQNFESNLKLVNQLERYAEKKGCTVSQLALAWLLKQGNDIIPIPGTKRKKYMEENWNALNVQFTDGEEMEIRQVLEDTEVMGYRSVPGAEKFDFVDTKEETVS
jgi:aryl-alcohol dehydrogenase-like predicted oxidoreductase